MRAGPLTKVPREIIISTSRPRRGRCRCVHSSSQSLARRSRGRRQQASRSARETDSYASESRPPVARRCLHRRHTPPPSHNARCHGDVAHKQHAAARSAFVWRESEKRLYTEPAVARARRRLVEAQRHGNVPSGELFCLSTLLAFNSVLVGRRGGGGGGVGGEAPSLQSQLTKRANQQRLVNSNS